MIEHPHDDCADALEEIFGRLDSIENRLAQLDINERKSRKPAGGQYREALLTLFAQHPQRYFRPAELAQELGQAWNIQVPLSQACRGLVKEGLVETRMNYTTKRGEYRLAQSAQVVAQ